MKRIVLCAILISQLSGSMSLQANPTQASCCSNKKKLYCAGAAYLILKVIGAACDISNVVESSSRPVELTAFPANTTLPDESIQVDSDIVDCSYELKQECDPEVYNILECQEYLEEDGQVVIEECVGPKETDDAQFGLGLGSFATRALELCFDIVGFCILERNI